MSISHGSRVTLREAVSSEHGMQEPIETEGGGGEVLRVENPTMKMYFSVDFLLIVFLCFFSKR